MRQPDTHVVLAFLVGAMSVVSGVSLSADYDLSWEPGCWQRAVHSVHRTRFSLHQCLSMLWSAECPYTLVC